ncbi:SAICAR synthase-like protein [Rhizoclosmatium globosum]|uniref:1-phosphatidylinositol-4-phosphate 5-kinase n=1 Tax=Rhizoclosmatium globosum TaxID=329046 RepID=A0A1Y2CVG2_9FUNG|nr:SAICAR synthase-like protein [Rhizoclosmatium globosum]|eukprot:ORY51012.1 SAICAR synthase-like protein [Rhizoclosmatium globosum]
MKKKRSDASTGSGILAERNYSFNRGRTASQNHGSSNLHQSTHQTDYQGDDVGSTKSAESAPETPRAKARTSLARVFTVQRPLSLGGREVLVGTPIKEGHVNYMVMYDMLTGIRISVGRCSAKANRDILEEDYTAAHKIAFDVKGNELAPNSGYDFKFKDYAPWIFRLVREIFKVDPVDYLLSLTGKYVLSELGSPGKSGSFFYFSQDYRFIIKTIHFSEHKFVRRILKQYYTHVKANPETLLSRIFGLHRCKLPGGKKIHFVVMGNVFPPNKDIHETYDLKGSLVGRLTPEESAKKPGAVLKDLNWLEKNRKVFLGPIKRDILVNQMEKDVAFLVANHIMDYSLLIGVHDLVKGNSHNIRDSVMSVIEPSAQDLNTHQALNRRSTMISPISVKRRQTIIEAESIKQGAANAKLDIALPPERAFCVFYKELGGFLSTNVNNEIMRDLYYIGIIDIFTEYSGVKKFEHFFKSLTNDRHKISAVHPKEYGDRFLKFMKDAIDSAGKPAPLSPLGQ